MFPAAINQRYFTISQTKTALQYVELSMAPKPVRQVPNPKSNILRMVDTFSATDT
jgi:hypothetical protein